jgi:membrane protein DedA with SNARE-associated domain
MPSIGDVLSAALTGLGWPGLLLAIFLVFMVDAAILPALPEVFTVAFYIQYSVLGVDPFGWAVALLVTALAGELAGNGIIYFLVSRLLVQKKRMPRIIDRAVKGWADFLVVRGEKVVLVNRFAPAVPLMGVFIAVCGWNVKKSFAYIVLGSLVKYSALLALVGYLNVAYDPGLAQWLTLAAVLIIVTISLVAAVIRRRRLKSERKPAEKA